MNPSVKMEPILNKVLQTFRSSPDAIFAVNEAQEILLWTAGMERLLGMPPDRAIGKFCYEVLQGADSFGNSYCCNYCPIMRTVEKDEPIHPFDLYVRTERVGEKKRLHCTHAIMVDQEDNSRICVYMLTDPEVPERKKLDFANPLTKRESEVLQCLAKGMGSAKIATALKISDTTARNHIQSILEKLGVHSRVEAVVLAYQQAWVS